MKTPVNSTLGVNVDFNIRAAYFCFEQNKKNLCFFIFAFKCHVNNFS